MVKEAVATDESARRRTMEKPFNALLYTLAVGIDARARLRRHGTATTPSARGATCWNSGTKASRSSSRRTSDYPYGGRLEHQASWWWCSWKRAPRRRSQTGRRRTPFGDVRWLNAAELLRLAELRVSRLS